MDVEEGSREFARYSYEIETLGFSIVPNVVSNDGCAELISALQVALREDAASYGHHSAKREDHVLDLVSYGGVFLRLLENEVMDRIYSYFLGAEWTLYTYSSTVLRPEVQQKTKPSSAIIHVDTSRFIPQYCSAMQMTLALDDFTESNGTSLYLPGSHKCEETPSAETFKSYAVKVTRKAGDALFWNPRVFHCSGSNECNETRNAISTYAVRPYIKSRFDYPRMLASVDESRFSDRLRRILGFNAAPPANVEEFYCKGEARIPVSRSNGKTQESRETAR